MPLRMSYRNPRAGAARTRPSGAANACRQFRAMDHGNRRMFTQCFQTTATEHQFPGSGDIRFDNDGGRRHASAHLSSPRNVRCVGTDAERLLYSFTKGAFMTRQICATIAAAACLSFSVSPIQISGASLDPVETQGVVNAPVD